MSNDNENSKRKPEHIAYAVRTTAEGPKYTRIGVGFSLQNGGISVIYDAQPASPQIVLLEQDAARPQNISYGNPTRKADFDACMVREYGENKSFWSRVGQAYKQDGYISIQLEAIPHGKLILTVPKEQEQ